VQAVTVELPIELHVAPVADIHPVTLYRLMALRADVFVVEQECAYSDLDGRDLESSARMLWAERDGVPISTLRLLIDPDGRARIGRVATAVAARSGGVAARLVTQAIESSGAREVVLEAQSQLQGWYERFGFVRSGPEYDEDGIRHVPMRRKAGP
jgi:ElaA protein